MEKDKKISFQKINIDGTKYKTLYTKKYADRKSYVPEDPRLVKAFIPGTIIKISVRRGRKVEEGDDILVLEAMKMQNQIKAQVSGKVKKINVKKGQMVSKNHVMIELE